MKSGASTALSAIASASMRNGVRVSPAARSTLSHESAVMSSGAPSNTTRRYAAPSSTTVPAGSMSRKMSRAKKPPPIAAQTPITNAARIPFHAASPARSRSPAPINWLTYAESPTPNTSLRAYTHHMTNTDVVMAAVARTPSPRTHSASIHWNASRSACEARIGSARAINSRAMGVASPPRAAGDAPGLAALTPRPAGGRVGEVAARGARLAGP